MEILPLFNAVEKGLFALVDFKQLFELSCHSIFVELFVNISTPYKFTIPMYAIEKHFLTKRTDKSASPLVSSSMSYGTVIQFLQNFSENLKADNSTFHFRQD
jgi:hypothetical protein